MDRPTGRHIVVLGHRNRTEPLGKPGMVGSVSFRGLGKGGRRRRERIDDGAEDFLDSGERNRVYCGQVLELRKDNLGLVRLCTTRKTKHLGLDLGSTPFLRGALLRCPQSSSDSARDHRFDGSSNDGHWWWAPTLWRRPAFDSVVMDRRTSGDQVRRAGNVPGGQGAGGAFEVVSTVDRARLRVPPDPPTVGWKKLDVNTL